MANAVTGLIRLVAASAVILLFIFNLAASAKTVVKRIDECTIEVRVPIEVHGPRATQELVDRWKSNIEGQWNGASQEIIDTIAADNGLDPENSADRNELNDLYKKFLEETGGDKKCFYSKCCKIFFVADVRLGSGTDGFHQVKAVPTTEGEWDTAGSIPLIGPYIGEFQIKKNRSFVMGLNGQSASTTGIWEDDPSGHWPPEAHEVGHLMGLKDEYSDAVDANGNLVSAEHEGHEHDLMADCLGWPQENGIMEILAIGGLSCDCCPREDSSEHLLAGPLFHAGNAIAACDPEAIQNSINDFQNRLGSLHMINMPLSSRYEAAKNIKDEIENLKKALEDCDKKTRPMTGSTGPSTALHLGDLGLTYAQDSTEWCTYGPGTETPPPGGDDPTDGPPPEEGDDPRDGPPPEETPEEEDDPRDLPDEEDVEDPRDIPGGDDVPEDEDDPRDLPDDDSDDPRDLPVPEDGDDPKDEEDGDDPRDAAEEDDPRDIPGPTVYVKAKTSVLQTPGGTTGGQPVAGQQVKLFTPSTDVALPSGEGEGTRPDADFDKDPLQCTTDSSGDCEIELADIQVTGNRMELDLTADQRQGVTVEVPSGAQPDEADVQPEGSGAKPGGSGEQPGAGLPEDLKDDVIGEFTVGDSTFYRLGFGLGAEYKLTLGDYNLKYEEDYCRDKQPGPNPDYAPATADRNPRALPEARISFSPTEEARP